MLNKSHNPVTTLFILLTLAGISQPARALSIAQNSETSFSGSSKIAREVDKSADGNFKERDSGSVNLDLEESGRIDFDAEDSGEINSDLQEQDSGSTNQDLEYSGSVNPDLEDSGSVNPDLEDSGQTLSFNNSRLYSQASPETDNDAIAPNGIEEEPIATDDDRGTWWWWLPLIIGIPLIAAILVSTLGGKRSDREPAIDNVRDPNAPNGGIGLSDAPGVEDLSTVGPNNPDLGNTVASSTTSRLGGAAVTSGTALAAGASSLVSDATRTEPVTEIPSNSVSEFTGQETKLQVSEETKLQDDIEDIDLHAEPLDTVPPNSTLSGLVSEPQIEKTPTIPVEEEIATYTQPDVEDIDISESSVDFPVDTGDPIEQFTSDSTIEADTAIEANEAKEFRGDYVLEEETQTITPNQQLAENITQSNQELNVDNSTTIEPDLATSEPEVSLTEIDADTNAITEQQAVNAELRDEAQILETTQTDFDIAEESNRLDDIALTSAAASGFIISESDSQPLVDTDTDIDPKSEQIANVRIVDPELRDEAQIAKTPQTNFNAIDIEQSDELQELSESESVLAPETTNDLNISIDEISFDDVNDSDLEEISFDDGLETADANLEEISFDDDIETIDANLEEISFKDVNDSDLDKVSFDNGFETADANLEEISFDDDIEIIDANLEEINFDDDIETIDASIDEIGFNDVNDSDLDKVNFDDSSDSNLDEITSEELSQTRDNSSLDLLSNNTAGISNLANDESEDMDNISEWLNSLETPTQSTDNILEWLDNLNTDDADSVREDSDRENNSQINEADDVSFQFIEDLLENDANQDNR